MRVSEYGDWSLDVHKRLATKRIPISGSIEVTQRCNNRCIHCYNNLPVGDRKAGRKELNLDEHRRILDQVAAAGCLWLLLTGGEIFIRNDFLDIYTYAKQKGFLITLFTNGTLITSDIADYLAEIPPFSIEITLYGYTAQTYERITGIPGSYARCLTGIRTLSDRKLPLKLKTMVVSANKHEIRDMRRFVEKDLGLEFKFDAMINPRLDCSPGPLNVRLSAAEVVALDIASAERTNEWKRFAKQFNKPVVNPDPADALYLCGAGYNTFAIDPYGQLRPCVLSSADSYDLRTGSFEEGWQTYLFNLRQKKSSRKTKCTACQIKSMCGMCPANGKLECADAESPVDFLCRVAHLRAYTMDLPIAPHGACEYCEGGSRYAELLKTAAGLRKRCT